MLIKCLVKFEDISTFLTTKTSNDIKFNKNLQLGGGLTVAPEPYDVRIRRERSLFLLLQTFYTTLARQNYQKTQTSKVEKFTFIWSYRDSILSILTD